MSRYLPPRLLRLAGPTSLIRRLSVQSVLSAFGDGVFLTGSAVFFTQIVGPLRRPGRARPDDRRRRDVRGRRTSGQAQRPVRREAGLGARSLVEALLYFGWLVVGGMVPFVALMIVLQVVSTASRSARNAYRFDVFPREERVSSNAYFRAARNVGYTLGALLAGVALATNSDDVIRAVPLVTAALLLLNATLVSRLPRSGARTWTPSRPSRRRSGGGRALRNRGYLLMSIFGGVLGTHQVLLNVVIPLWLVAETDAPRVLLAWLFGTNTVMAVLLQVAAARGVVTVADSLRAQRRGAVFFVLSCGIVLVTHDTVGWVTIRWCGSAT